MLNDFNRSDNRRGQKCIFTSVVILQKDSTGIVQACPTSNNNIIGSRIYSVNSKTKRLSSNVVVLSRTYRQKHLPMIRFADMTGDGNTTLNIQSKLKRSTKQEHWKPRQRAEKPLTPAMVTSVSSVRRLNKVLYILLTAFGILLISRHKKLIGLVNWLGGVFITARTVSKK